MLEFEQIEKRLPEKPKIANVYAHLFPGNDLSLLPYFDIRNTWTGFWWLQKEAATFQDLRRRHEMILAAIKGQKFAYRQSFRYPDRITLPLYLSGLTPVDKIQHSTSYQNHSLADLVNANMGERLGGVAIRPLSPHQYPVVKLRQRAGENPFLKQPEIIIGVINVEYKPVALIHLVEGENPRS